MEDGCGLVEARQPEKIVEIPTKGEVAQIIRNIKYSKVPGEFLLKCKKQRYRHQKKDVQVDIDCLDKRRNTKYFKYRCNLPNTQKRDKTICKHFRGIVFITQQKV